MFTHLHVHTEYSMLDGAARIEPLVERAKQLGQTSLAITDHGVMYGVVDFYKMCKKHGIKPIIGCEVYVAARTMKDMVHKLDSRNSHLVLLAKSKQGYENLIRLVSMGFTDGFYYKPRIDYELLSRHSAGLIGLSACLAGEIPTLLLEGKNQQAVQLALRMKDIFEPDSFFLELQDHKLLEQRKLNPLLCELSKETSLPLVATNDVHYIKQEHAKIQDILLCIQTKTLANDTSRMKFGSEEFYLKSAAEMERLFQYAPLAISNTMKIAEMCDFEFDFGKTYLPEFIPPDNLSSEQFLRKLCSDGILERYESPSSRVLERLEYELDVIIKCGFVDYFLIVWDFVHFAKDKGIFVGPGRGSGAGSIVAFVLGITDVEPIKYNLLFERFLNPERVTMPDFDIDFCYERRGEVINYVIEKYGAEHVAQIVTFSTLAARQAVSDVGRVLDMPLPFINNLAKMLPSGATHVPISEALSDNHELKCLFESDPRVKQVLEIASEIEGLPRNCSTHAAGVVISKLPISSIVPLSKNDNTTTTQFPMGTLEELGLLKMDLLGLRTLTVIRDSLALCGRSIDRWDYNIPEVYELISKGNTNGVFQLERSGMTKFMMELRPTNLEDIIAGISLYRPGPMDSIGTYLRNKGDPSKIEYKTPELKEILDVTYGCIVYQEQVMQIVRTLAGYTLGEADVLRRAMSKKKANLMENERQTFLLRCEKRGVSKDIASEIFEQIADFAKYAFNKSHATAYASLAYQTAYLKTFHPSEFFAALMTNSQDSMAKISKYAAECRAMGIKLLPPCVNRSMPYFTTEDGNIRFGLAYIKNVGRRFTEDCVAVRESGGLYKDFEDFVRRLSAYDVKKRSIECLILSGAFDFTGAKRAQLHAGFDVIIERLNQTKRNTTAGQLSLFDEPPPSLITHPQFSDIPEFESKVLLAHEQEQLGVYLSGHPLDEFLPEIKRVSTHTIDELLEMNETEDGCSVTICGTLKSRTNKTTKTGEQMAFLKIVDTFGEIEVLVFPKLLQSCESILTSECLKIMGKLSIREEMPTSLLANLIQPLQAPRKQFVLKMSKEGLKQLDAIRPIVLKNTGNMQLILDVSGDKRYVTNFFVNPSLKNALKEIFHGKN